jgi:hypothetical protein
MNKKKDKFYYKDGTTTSSKINESKVLHRVGGPAVERADGTKVWFVYDKMHRVDGPAIEYANGDKNWYVDGKLHRVDGPAIERANGYKYWYIDGKRHRVDGPAVEWVNGDKYWYVDGKKYTEEQFNELIKQIDKMSLVMKLTDPRQWVRELGEKEVG